MDDIVERLLKMAYVISDEGEEALLEDAAAEIERLRAALRKALDCPQECKTVGNEEAEMLRELGYYNVKSDVTKG